MLSAPSPSPVPQGSQLQSEIPSQWNPYVIGPLIAVCIAVLFFSYYGILNRLCWAFITLTFSRNRVQMRLLNGDNLQDLSSFQFHSHGLESTIRHSLPVSQFKKKKEEEPRSCNHECAVCLGEFEDGEWLKHLPICGHVFHVACIDTWFQTHSNCPLCRSHVCDLTNDCSISMNTLLESLRREDFFHERAQHYQILRSEILHNSALGPGDLEQRTNSFH